MENIPKQESFADKNIKEMTEKGFQFISVENLGRDIFDSETARFLPTVEQSAEDIKTRYSEKGKYEIELILMPSDKIEDMKRKGIVTEEESLAFEIPEAEKSYLVFRKPAP
jgi:hypothetical protein